MAYIDKMNVKGTNYDIRDNGAEGAIAIMATGNTHVAIASGQFVYVKGHSSLKEGLYTANAAINANGALSTSNLTESPSGAANALKSQIDTVNSNIPNDTIYTKYANPIAANTDLDDVQEPGTHTIDSANVSRTIGHYPSSSHGNCKVLVLRNTGVYPGEWYGCQILIRASMVYIRSHTGTTWDNWFGFLTGEEPPKDMSQYLTFVSGYTPNEKYIQLSGRTMDMCLIYSTEQTINNSTKIASINTAYGVWKQFPLQVFNYSTGKPINGSLWIDENGNLTYFGDKITSTKIIIKGTWFR